MRVWDQVEPRRLCRQHLLGEHREVHGLMRVLERRGGGYWNHPETRRWEGREGALAERHEELAAEMLGRGYAHRSPLAAPPRPTSYEIPAPLDDQAAALRAKGCGCDVPA